MPTMRCECGQEFRTPKGAEGKRVRCPHCGRPVAVPAARASSSRRRGSARARSGRSRSSRTPVLIVGIAVAAVVVVGILCVVVMRRRGAASGAQASVHPTQTARQQARQEPTPRPWASNGQSRVSYSNGDVARLADRIGSRDRRARVAAARSLAAMGPQAHEAVAAILAALSRPSIEIELQSALSKALKRIGPAGIPQLLAALKSSHPRTRFYAAQALMKIGPEASSAVAALAHAVESDPDYSVRSNAAAALGAIGPAASSALPALRRAAGNPNARLGPNAARAELRVRAQTAIHEIKGTFR